MFRLYSLNRTQKVISKMEPAIRRVSDEYRVPQSALKAVMYRETKEIDLFDAAADVIVLVKTLGKLLHRTDSSTGYMQIYGFVGVNALNFASDHGIPLPEVPGLSAGRRPDARDAGDVRAVWLKLHGDREFNLRLAALNLLSCAWDMNGSCDFAAFTPEEMKRTFSRYNANTKTITRYGEEVYGYFQEYEKGLTPAAR